jgi:hypothetical protein
MIHEFVWTVANLELRFKVNLDYTKEVLKKRQKNVKRGSSHTCSNVSALIIGQSGLGPIQLILGPDFLQNGDTLFKISDRITQVAGKSGCGDFAQ